MSDFALKTKKIEKRFDGVKAVNNLSIDLPKGKIVGLIGPNGSGKTTFINLLSGMLPIDDGSIVIDESSIEHMKPNDVMYYGITRTFQDVRLFEQMTVMDNIFVVLTERNVFSSIFEKHKEHHVFQAKEVLEQVGLLGKQNELAVNLSYGQRKLLEIARTIAMKAEIYLFDEPFAGLFPEMVKIVEKVMGDLRDSGKTVILVEHNMNIIRNLCEYVFVMDAGELLAEGSPEEVLGKREVIEAYLGD